MTAARRNAVEELAGALTLPACESLARKYISDPLWARIQGGAADESTLRWNREAYEQIRLRPRVLVDVSKLDTRVALLGESLSFPIVLCPTGVQGWIRPGGELAVARGAGAADTILIASSVASVPIEDIVKATTGTVWFQLYIQKDRGFTRDLVHRAEAAGCRALCITVDTPIKGVRDRQLRSGALPERPLPNLEGKELDLDPGVNWRDVEWLVSLSRTPVLLKGILDPEDADIAVNTGASAIAVSNHGARNLDSLPASITALPLVADTVAGRVPLLVDGGIRRGTDVLKALALGADAVGIGRPYLHGLAVGGAEGVTRIVEILKREFEIAMMLTGRPNVASIDTSVLWPT